MAKTTDQRIDELAKGVTWVVANVWATETAAYSKELNAPIFKGKGDVAGMAKRFDATQSRFTQNIDKKDKAKEIFDKAGPEIEKNDKQWDAAQKRIDEIPDQSTSSIHQSDSSKVEDVLKNWEEALKATQAANKETKALYDQLAKLDAAGAKIMEDTIAKATKEIEGAKSVLNSANTELNGLEAQIRTAIGNYANVADSMDKPEIAKAVKNVLKVFGGK